MKNFRNIFFYVVIVGGFSVIMYLIVLKGAHLQDGGVGVTAPSAETAHSHWSEFVNAAIHNFQEPLSILLLQIVTIIIVARVFGWICMKIGQPTVVGEVIAGIVLGPSLVGLYFPEISAILFPAKSLDNLKILSQIGLIIFMFVVGMELDLKVLRNQARDAVVISHASIIVPFALGMALAFYIYKSFAPPGVLFSSFGLFMGIAMSITAFPVLARIVQERGIQRTRLGMVAITCAAADDVTAWCILATVIAIVKAGSFLSSVYVIALAVAYVIVMINVVRPFLRRVGDLHTSRENLSKPIVAIFFLTLILSAYIAELIGIHALFGAFMAGAIMPENVKFRNLFIEKVEDLALVLLLPLFFVFTGLRTQIGLLNDASHWLIAGVIIAVAVTGKFFGSAIAAKFVGQNWKDSLTIGALMNTRGLMELVVLNIGYDLGVLTPEVFAMMVIMALVTTFMTSPALDLINRIFKREPEEQISEVKELSKYKILLSFANPASGRTLLRLANGLTKKLDSNASLTAMHLSPVDELHHFNEDEYEKESFAPVIEESKELNQKVTTLFKASNDIDTDIITVANKGDYDLLLIGLGQSIYEGSLLGKVLGFTTQIINPEKLLNSVTRRERLFDNSPFDERTQAIVSRSQVPVGILMDKNLSRLDRIFIPVYDQRDANLINYAQKLIHNSESQVVIWDGTSQVKNNTVLKEKIRAIEQNAPNHIALRTEKNIGKEFLKQHDLMIVTLETWKELVNARTLWLQDTPSILIIQEK